MCNLKKVNQKSEYFNTHISVKIFKYIYIIFCILTIIKLRTMKWTDRVGRTGKGNMYKGNMYKDYFTFLCSKKENVCYFVSVLYATGFKCMLVLVVHFQESLNFDTKSSLMLELRRPPKYSMFLISSLR